VPFCRECGKQVEATWKVCPHCANTLENASSNISVRDSAIAGDIITNVNDAKTISQGYKQAIKEIEKEEQKKKRIEAKKISMKQRLIYKTLGLSVAMTLSTLLITLFLIEISQGKVAQLFCGFSIIASIVIPNLYYYRTKLYIDKLKIM
tara:strand:- start:114 stop:560 length:447 start_codon:yes stop_codon:yes gene_type:complete